MILDIYNIKGQKVRTLAMDKTGEINWDLFSDNGSEISTGIYIIKPHNVRDSRLTKVII
jgi:hypothetical protein